MRKDHSFRKLKCINIFHVNWKCLLYKVVFPVKHLILNKFLYKNGSLEQKTDILVSRNYVQFRGVLAIAVHDRRQYLVSVIHQYRFPANTWSFEWHNEVDTWTIYIHELWCTTVLIMYLITMVVVTSGISGLYFYIYFTWFVIGLMW